MKNVIILFMLSALPLLGFSQNDSTHYNTEDEFNLWGCPEKMPEFPGGVLAMMKYLDTKAIYTERAINDSAKGTVYVTFMVMHTGKINDVRILRGIHPDLDSISIKLINDMPDWIPAENRGKSIDCQYNLPIKFGSQGIGKPQEPEPSKYWRKKGLRKLSSVCREKYNMNDEEINCWYRFIIWNYNSYTLKYLDLGELFKKQKCEFNSE